MLFILIRSELARHLRNHRLLVLYVGGPALMVAAALFHVSEAGEQRADRSRLAQAAGNATNLDRMVILRPFATLAFLRAAPREERAEVAIVSPHFVDAPEAGVADRTYLFVATPLDWSAVVIFFYSLMAVALSYDAVAGEKAAGTLRLLASRPVGRPQLLLAKVVSGFAVVAGSLVLGVLAGLAVAAVAPGFVLEIRQGAVLALAVLLMLAFLLVNVLLGVAASVSTSAPETALQRALATWAVLAVGLPGLIVVLGTARHPTESELTFQRNLTLHEQSYWARLSVSSVPLTEIVRTPGLTPTGKRQRIADLQAEMLADQEAALVEMERGHADLRREHLLRSALQEEWVDRWSALSPHSLLRTSLERLVIGGASGRREFRRQVAQFEPVFTSFVIGQRELRRDEARELSGAAFHTDEDGETYELRGLSQLDYSTIQVPADDFPRFGWSPPSVAALAKQAAFDILLTFVFATVLFTFVFLRFQGYDCR